MTGPSFFGPEAEILRRSSFWKTAYFLIIGGVMIVMAIILLLGIVESSEEDEWIENEQSKEDDLVAEGYMIAFTALCGIGGVVFLVLGLQSSSNNQPQVIIVQQSAVNQPQKSQYVPPQQEVRFSKQPPNQQPPRYP